MTFVEVHVKRSVILTDRLGPDIFLVLTMKRQVLHRERAHLKVPGCSLVLSALLTKTQSKASFLVILNYSKMIPRLVESFRNLHLFHSNATKT